MCPHGGRCRADKGSSPGSDVVQDRKSLSGSTGGFPRLPYATAVQAVFLSGLVRVCVRRKGVCVWGWVVGWGGWVGGEEARFAASVSVPASFRVYLSVCLSVCLSVSVILSLSLSLSLSPESSDSHLSYAGFILAQVM